MTPYLKREPRTFEECLKARRDLRGQRRALKVCLDCGDPNITDVGYCEKHTTLRQYGGDVVDLNAADIKAWGG